MELNISLLVLDSIFFLGGSGINVPFILSAGSPKATQDSMNLQKPPRIQ